MGSGVVLAEVAGVGGHLVDVRLLGGGGILELEHHDLRAGEDNDVRAASSFAGKLVLEDDLPMPGARHPGSPGGEALAEHGDLMAPRGHLAGVGTHVHAAVVMGGEESEEVGFPGASTARLCGLEKGWDRCVPGAGVGGEGGRHCPRPLIVIRRSVPPGSISGCFLRGLCYYPRGLECRRERHPVNALAATVRTRSPQDQSRPMEDLTDCAK